MESCSVTWLVSPCSSVPRRRQSESWRWSKRCLHFCWLLMWRCLHKHTCMMISAFIAQNPCKVICMVWHYSSCSSSWVQDLHFNYKVLFPTSAWLLTPSLPGTCTSGGNTVKTVFLRSSSWGPWGDTSGATQRSLAETSPLYPFPFLPPFPGDKEWNLGSCEPNYFYPVVAHLGGAPGFSAWQQCRSLVPSTVTIQGLYV